MKEMVYRSLSLIKGLLREKSNIIIFLLLLNLILTTYVYLELSDGQYHFYMNTKKSLEEIHNVEIDSYDETIKTKLDTNSMLLRKQHRRFHLKYLFK